MLHRGTALRLLLPFVVACASAPQVAPNRYGLRVLSDLAAYEQLARLDPAKRLARALAEVQSELAPTVSGSKC